MKHKLNRRHLQQQKQRRQNQLLQNHSQINNRQMRNLKIQNLQILLPPRDGIRMTRQKRRLKMKDLLNYIVTSLVSNKDAIAIDEQAEGTDIILTLTVDPADMGLIIGKNGQTIRAIRKLLTVRAIAENVRVNLQLTEPQKEPGAENQDSSEKLTA